MVGLPRLVTTVAMTVLLFELVILKDHAAWPWNGLLDGASVVLGVYLGAYLAVLLARWLR